MPHTVSKLVPLLALALFSGCALKTIDIRKQTVSEFSRAAIIGLDGDVRVGEPPRNQLTAMIGAFKGASDVHWPTRRLDQGDAAYEALSGVLSTGMGWTLVPKEQLSRSPTLEKVVDRMWDQFPKNQLRARHLLTQPLVNGLPQAQRAAIAQELGVDTLVTVSLSYRQGERRGVSIAGMGSTNVYPSAQVQFRAFDREGKLVWVDYMAIGAPAQTGLRTTMGVAVLEHETRALTEAALNAFAAVITRYQGYVEQAGSAQQVSRR